MADSKKTSKKTAKTSGTATATAPFDDQQQVTLVTKEGYQKLIEELEYLKGTRRKEIAEQLKEAISYGDLSENSEYDAAKTEQARLEARIAELEEKMKYVRIIEEKHHGATVQLGSTVLVRNISDKNSDSEKYTIVGSTEADPLSHKISNESPVGSSLLDKRKGDIVKVHIPSGVVEYEILELE